MVSGKTIMPQIMTVIKRMMEIQKLWHKIFKITRSPKWGLMNIICKHNVSSDLWLQMIVNIFKSHSTKCWGLLLMEILSVCLWLIISSPVIGQTVQKLVPHWIRPGAMFRSRIKFWGVGGEMLITVQFYTNRFCQLKQVWYAIMQLCMN